MKRIARHACYFFASAFVCAAALAAIIFLQPPNWKPYAAAALAGTLITALLSGRAGEKVKAARLIVENQILNLQPAIYVSCFGILLDTRIIKFNRDGIRLLAVEIGRDYLSLDYGTDTTAQNVRLRHTGIDSDSLEDISERFRYETGIVPTIMD